MSGLSVALAGRMGGFALDMAFEAPAGGVTALFGPSGSGKTTILRAIAGLERLSGHCALGETVWQDAARFVPTHRRAIGYVFQEPSLFPHLSVKQNLEFGLRRAGMGSVDLSAIVSLLGIEKLLARAPAKLSGGERQRVSLGRALLSQPKLLLLDEPMSALDRAAKEEILPYFEALHQALAIPIVLVSHDITEVERLAERVVVIGEGRVVASGPLNDMLLGEALGVKRSRDAAAVLSARVLGFDAGDGLSELELCGQRLLVAGVAGAPGAMVRVRIAARDVSLAVTEPSASTILNRLRVRIVGIEAPDGADATVVLDLGGAAMLARVTTRSVRALGLHSGQEVFAQVKGVSLVTGPR
ncbi:MAG TPA: molybdenum ABC transporter ATP-binding protein [Arsenicitalea sp.]|jgi:molybdate transport system ATP-binding protein|nr:molybdenum ABC transporter ATP-binding protein [Arsenicitalea sp.]